VARLESLGARGVVVDGLDGAAVGEAVASAEPDAVVHQMSALSGKLDPRHFDRSFALTNRLRTEGLDHLIAAAQATGVPHVVAQSFTGWPNIRSGGWVKDEEDPLDPEPPTAQRETLGAIRYLEETVRKEDGTVLRYGGFYGDASDAMVPLVRKRQLPVVGGGTGYASWVHLDDAATATVLALEQEARGVFNIVDDEPAPASEWLPYLADCVGAKPPLRLPVWVARLAAGEVAVSMLTRTRGSSNARAKRELGWELRWPSWRQGFRHGLANG
jgi:nucleoside-diphosphate-sugar epimerase